MPTPITETTVNFTYKIPDKKYGTTDELGKTASAVYSGPDRVWVFVDETTGKINRGLPPLTSQDDGDSVPVPPGLKRIEVVAENDPFVISLLRVMNCEVQNQENITETLPNGETLTYEKYQAPDQCHEPDDLTYNFNSNSWQDLPYIDSGITWDDVLNFRNGALTASDGRISPDMPDDIKKIWTDYRQALRDLPTTFGKGTDSEVEAWKVRLPAFPGE